MVEVHPNPDRALSDGAQSLYPEQFVQLMNQLRRYRMRSMSLRGGLDRSLAEHAAILDAVERRDADAAARLLADHIQMPQRLLRASPEGELVQITAGREPSA